ncbi:MAG: glycosyltransferase family 2 protein [Candidatus Omnitrophica bacterium]|nr:glycosyltransferase family 2 protein [Candidatus Omnitrophota bacterium]
MGKAGLVSVIIINYNGCDLLKECLSSVTAQSYAPIEIIVVDNGSVDSSVEFLRNNYPQVKLILNKENLGFAEAANQGILKAKGEFIALLNNDACADPHWISSLVKVMLENPQIGSCASKLINYNDHKIIDAVGLLLHRAGFAKSRAHQQVDSGQFDIIEEVFACHGAAAFYRKKMLEEIGLFDADYFAYNEEFDLGLRAQLAGFRCLYVPQAVVYHQGGKTRAKQDEEFRLYHMERNRLWTIFKDWPIGFFFFCFPYFLKYELEILLNLNKYNKKAVIKARIDFLKRLPQILKKRYYIQRKRKVSIKYLRNLIKNN